MKEEIIHRQRTDVILRGWCGIALDGNSKSWTITPSEVTCKKCLSTMKKYKDEDELKPMTAGWSKDFL